MERTLVVLKGDAVQRQLVGQILHRFERKGLKIVGLKLLAVSMDLAKRMYKVHEGKEFHPALLEFITAAPVVAMVLEGNNAISVTRGMMGPTFGPAAPGGTIRGDFALSQRYNLIHGSDSPESAAAEIPLFFQPGELVDYRLLAEQWIYARKGDQLI